jgi:tRNA(Ile)-lysidine synthase
MQEDNAHAYFDLKKTGTELSIRPCCSGDRFVPFGMRGSKLVSDLLTDLKLPATEKERQLVLTSGERIAWVVGRRSSNEFRIDEGTTKVLEMQVIKSMQE